MFSLRVSSGIIAVLVFATFLLAACTPGVAPSPTPPPAPTATPNPKQALIGTWTSTVTKEDVLRVVPDFQQEFLCDNTGTFTWEFRVNGTFTIDQTALPGCPTLASAHVEDSWSIDGNLVTLAKGTSNQETYGLAVNADTLVLTYKSGECVPCRAVNTANPWERVK